MISWEMLKWLAAGLDRQSKGAKQKLQEGTMPGVTIWSVMQVAPQQGVSENAWFGSQKGCWLCPLLHRSEAQFPALHSLVTFKASNVCEYVERGLHSAEQVTNARDVDS